MTTGSCVGVRWNDQECARVGHNLGTNESASYWMPSSTRSSRDGEIIRPNALATLTLKPEFAGLPRPWSTKRPLSFWRRIVRVLFKAQNSPSTEGARPFKGRFGFYLSRMKGGDVS